MTRGDCYPRPPMAACPWSLVPGRRRPSGRGRVGPVGVGAHGAVAGEFGGPDQDQSGLIGACGVGKSSREFMDFWGFFGQLLEDGVLEEGLEAGCCAPLTAVHVQDFESLDSAQHDAQGLESLDTPVFDRWMVSTCLFSILGWRSQSPLV